MGDPCVVSGQFPHARKGRDMKLQREDIILNLLAENRVVKANDLAEQFGVSMETIRRDLSDLEKRHLIRRVHGGAVLNVAGSVEPDYGRREIENYEQKIRIGKKAAEYVEDGDSIILDIGTTTLEFARFLKGKKITVFTNSIKIAMELMEEECMQVLLLGGKLRMGEGTTSGPWAEDMIRQFYADKLFLGVGALHPEKGITDYHMEETNLRRLCITHARKVIALADYSKFGNEALNVVCEPAQLDVLITDELADKKILRELREKGVEAVTA